VNLGLPNSAYESIKILRSTGSYVPVDNVTSQRTSFFSKTTEDLGSCIIHTC